MLGLCLFPAGALASAETASHANALIRIQLSGYLERHDAEHVARGLDTAGIETAILTFSPTQGFGVSAGVFGQAANAQKMEQRLRDLGHGNITRVALLLNGSPVVPVVPVMNEGVPVATAAENGRLHHSAPRAAAQPETRAPIIIGARSGENDPVLEFGTRPPPHSSAVVDEAAVATPVIRVEQLRAEAGVLPRSNARASGSHYLHGTLAAEWAMNEAWSARLAARADGYVQTGDNDFEAAELDYGESYLRYRDPNRRITLGAQTVLWGQVDEIPPTDRLSVQDISRFVLDDLQDRRRAVLSARWEEFVGVYKLDALYVPFFRAAELPREASLWSPVDRTRGRLAGMPADPLMAPLVRDGRFTEDDDGRGGWGVRLSRAGRGLDYAVTVQDARHSLPYYALDPQVREALLANPSDVSGALAAAPNTFIASHPRTWVVGGDVGFATDQATWRFEAAWLSDQPATSADFRLIELEAVEWVAGVDFFPGDGELRVTLQLGGSHLLDAPDGLLDPEDRFNLYGDLENSFARDRWRARLRLFQRLDERDTYLNPSLSFVGWEPHEITVGYHHFDGSEKTLGGFYKNNDMLTLGWRARY